MNLNDSEKEILSIIQNEKIYYQKIFEIIHEDKIQLNDEFINLLHDSFVDVFFNQLLNINEEARIDHLDETINTFKTVFNNLIIDYSPEFETQKLIILAKNIIGTLKKKIKLLSGYENKKLSHPIQVNCDNVVLASIFLELSKQLFIEKKIERRISHLISDNFLSKNGTPIKLETIYKEMTEGGGITQKAKDNTKAILEKIINKLI
jgi:hypothetical protein